MLTLSPCLPASRVPALSFQCCQIGIRRALVIPGKPPLGGERDGRQLTAQPIEFGVMIGEKVHGLHIARWGARVFRQGTSDHRQHSLAEGATTWTPANAL